MNGNYQMPQGATSAWHASEPAEPRRPGRVTIRALLSVLAAFLMVATVNVTAADATVFIEPSDRWQAGTTIGVCYINPEATTQVHLDAIVAGARQWSDVANVSFLGFAKCSPTATDVRIFFTSLQGRNEAVVGTDNRGDNQTFYKFETDPQPIAAPGATMALSPYCLDYPDLFPDLQFTPQDSCLQVATHEFGHVLGFIHGQWHPDAVVPSDRIGCMNDERRIREDNGDPNLMPVGAVVVTETYVRDSIMNYCRYEYNFNPRLSATDISEVRRFFPGSPGRTTVANCVGIAATIVGSGTVRGTAGHDVILGYGGNDYIYGYGGNDRICGGAGNDNIWGGVGNDVVYGQNGTDNIRGQGGVDNLQGGNGNDTITGGANNDHIYGQGGHDRLYGEAGNDRLYGASGNDLIRGNDGRDHIVGGSGHDTLHGDDQIDVLYGQDGDDKLYGGYGDDTVYAGNGVDIVSGGAGADNLQGGGGNDTIKGDGGNDLLYGQGGRDSLNGGSGADTCYGGGTGNTLVACE